jgi:hypothetical protein
MGFPSLAGYKPSSGNDFEPIPTGKYLVAITGVEFMANATGWEGVKFELTVQSGQHAKRKLWRLFTTKHEKADVVQRGLEDLVGLLTAAGHPNPASPDSAPVKGLQFVAKVARRKSKKSGEWENQVTGWSPKSEWKGEEAGVPASAAQTSLSLASLGAASSAGSLAVAASPPADGKLNDEIPF